MIIGLLIVLDIINGMYMADVSMYIKIILFSIILLILVAVIINHMNANGKGEGSKKTVIELNDKSSYKIMYGGIIYEEDIKKINHCTCCSTYNYVVHRRSYVCGRLC